MKARYLFGLLLSLVVLLVTGCGGGGGGGTPVVQPTLAIVKVATSGTLPAGTAIGGIQATVTYPSAGLTIAAGDVAASGSGTGATFASNTATTGQVILGLTSATGIQAGEFATLNFHVAAGTFPNAGNFAIAAGATVIDVNGAPISGMSVVVQSVAIL